MMSKRNTTTACYVTNTKRVGLERRDTVTFSDSDEDANAVLFIFETTIVRRYRLKLYRDSVTVSSNVVLDEGVVTECFKTLLEENCLTPIPDGSVAQIAKIGGVRLLLWKFSRPTACSSAEKVDFHGIVEERLPDRILNPEKTTAKDLKDSVSYPFFSLQRPTVNTAGYTMLSMAVTENDRVEALFASVSEWLPKEFQVVHFMRDKSHYCRFSGGGDLLIRRKKVPIPLVFVSAGKNSDDTSVREVSPTTSGTSSEDSEVDPSTTTEQVHLSSCEISPLSSGATRLTNFALEAKKQTVTSNFQYQLWANMMVATVKEFVRGVEEEGLSKSEMFSIKQLEGYGIAVAGDGTLGMYKLEMIFNEVTKFVPKVNLECFLNRADAALMLDESIAYFIDKFQIM